MSGVSESAFIFRSCYERRIEVYNDRLDRWEEELLSDLVATVPFPLKLQVKFTHARKVRTVEMALGWFKIRLLDTHQVLWVLAAKTRMHIPSCVLSVDGPTGRMWTSC